MQADMQTMLDQLRDIHQPPDVGVWPLALGWWLLLAMAILLVVSFIWFNKKRKRRPLKALQAELRNIQVTFAVNKDQTWLLQNLSIFLRRTIKTIRPDDTSLNLSGLAWLQYLDRVGKTQEFTEGPGTIFGLGPYQAVPKFDTAQLISLVNRWLVKVS